MKLTKKLEAEVLKFYHDYWDAYLAGDIKSFSTALDDAVTIVGTSISEIFQNKKQTIKFYKDTVDQMTNSVRLRNRKISLQPVGSTVIIHEQMDFYVLLDEKWAFYGHARLSAVLIQTKKSWKLVHQHASFPDSRAEEGEQMASKQIAAENLKLREAVERHTVELRETNRELEIETALEKVRAIAMGMKEAADMLEICKIISQELNRLGIKEIRNVQTAIIYKEKQKYLNYEFYAKHNKLLTTETEYANHTISKAFVKQMLSGPGSFFKKSLKGKKVQEWYTFQKTTNQFADKYLAKSTSLNYYWYSLGPVALGISTYEPLDKTEQELFVRFRNVFELSYRRYLDIEKAEAQAKEAKIETSLERIRAAAMSMMKPEELLNISEVMVKEFHVLGFQTIRNAQIDIFNDNKKTYLNYECESEHFRKTITEVQYDSHPIVQAYLKQIRKAGDAFFSFAIKGKDFDNWKAWLKTLGYTENARLEQTSSLNYYNYSIGVGSLGISTYGPLDEDRISILKRFRNVFGLAYRRYADIAQAEAQAREGQIQLALERVRARTMAMQKSDELKDVAHELRVQLAALGTSELETCAINLYEEYDESLEAWAAVRPPDSPKDIVEFHFLLPKKGILIIEDMLEAYASGVEEFLFELTGEKGTQWMNKMAELVPGMFAAAAATPDFKKTGSVQAWFSCHYFSGGSLIMITMTPPLEESRSLMKRCAQVFGLAYRRFADLKKAEAQTREATIEVSLERVRAKAMAMHKSDDLTMAVTTVFEELDKLNLGMLRCGIGILNKETRCANVWTTAKSGEGIIVQVSGNESMDIHPLLHGAFETWLKEKDFSYELNGEDLGRYYHSLHATNYSLPGNVQPDAINNEELKQYYFKAHFQDGGLFAFRETPFPIEAISVMKRFAAVFNLTYKRFLDLQKAEAQTREAQIEAALERVRSVAMGMMKSEDLMTICKSVFTQLQVLGFDALRAAQIYIRNDDEKKFINYDYSDDTGADTVEVNYNSHPYTKRIYDVIRNAGDGLIHNTIAKKELDEWKSYLYNTLGQPPEKSLETAEELHYYLYSFGIGAFGICTFKTINKEELEILKRFRNVFNLSYHRYSDIALAEAHALQAEEDLIKLQTEKKRAEEALTELRATQTQLIQSEKMASLGQLTAGIAHEIQNPLNFVNNFSEVSEELIKEMMEEVDKGNIAEVKNIASDLIQNLGKIYHHGKRADSIVKGMLEHSRTSAGNVQPTDINALADEYLRLSYHGLRAKDKSFNTTIHTDFDNSIGTINIVGQDIARVLLNLYNNAFYAVNEKKKSLGNSYQPSVTVITKHFPSLLSGKERNGIIITVADNGNGIPQNIVDKIFQPFFTTKPTGQGTGLGLSLAYDIIKAHGGEIKTETKEDEGTEFIIQLPAT